MLKVLYIHGLGSSSESSTGQLLHNLSDDKIIFYNPSFSIHPKIAIEEVNKFIKDNDIDMVIGSSLGGFYALQSDCDYGVVINPALAPIKDITESIGYGEHKYTHREETYVIDEKYISELEWIIRRKYKGENPNDWYLEFNKKRIFAGLFGNRDELFSHYDDFHSINSDLVVLIGDMGHRFDPKNISMLEALIETVEKLIN